MGIGQIQRTKRENEIERFYSLISNWANLYDKRDKATHCLWAIGAHDELERYYRGELIEEAPGQALITKMQKLADNLEKLAIEMNLSTLEPAQQQDWGSEAVSAAASYTISPMSIKSVGKK